MCIFFARRTQSAIITHVTCPQIREGDMLLAHHPLIQIDEAAFGSTAREFNPRRFVQNPKLKEKVNCGFHRPRRASIVALHGVRLSWAIKSRNNRWVYAIQLLRTGLFMAMARSLSRGLHGHVPPHYFVRGRYNVVSWLQLSGSSRDLNPRLTRCEY